MVTTTCYIISGDECSKKKKKKEEKKRERLRGNKKGQVPGTSKENIEHLILLKKFQKSKKGMYPLKRAKVELDFHHCYHHHHHTPFIRHTCTS